MDKRPQINRDWRWKLGVTLTGIWLLSSISACEPEPKTKTDGAATEGKESASKSPRPPLLADWPEPKAAIVFTGDVHGHLEPCGCSERQSGGFARRGDLLRQLREEKKWPTTALDIGGSLNAARVTYPQSRIKFSIMLKGLNELGYQGMALGKEELLLGPQDLYTEFTRVESEENFHVPFLGANTTIFGSKELGTPSEYRIVEVGGLKIGVTAVAGNSTRKALENSGITRDPNELLVQDPGEILPGILEKLKAENPDVLVLLSAAEMDESKALAKEYPDFDIVVTSGSAEDPRSNAVYIGQTLLVQVGKKGKNAAVVGLLPDGEMKYTVIELDMDRFDNLPSMHDLMADYQSRLKEAWPELTAQKISDPASGPFVGAQACKECHSYAYGVWSETKHAHALDSLKKGRPGQEANWISRIYDPECLACHTTGWEPQKALRYESGFIDEQQTPLLAGQQCENCHGAGAEHVSLEKAWKPGKEISPELKQARDAMRLTLTRAKTEVCLRCHDGDNSPQFDFEKYWPKVNHTGRKD